ncbi:MAG: zinc carboxypeptidase, partial [Candidatus Lokiarchaeota archaeon]|nr:zinc carboxypeptidase [Candidatus Lokiarchaeota archaeon]
AEEFTHVEMNKLGTSREGRPIYCLKIGKGEENALLFSFPHPNEPIGSMSLEFLSQFLAKNPEFTKKTGYTWYLIKAIDIDGAILNEGWFKGDFNPLKYAKNYYRPASYEQVEWSFPISYKKLKFETPAPETQALMHLIQKIKPKFMYSLHNSGFGGVYFYISYGIGNLFDDFVNFVKKEHLPLHLGEPEAPYIKKLHEGIFQMFGVQKQYDYLDVRGIENPQEFIKNGTSSYDYLKSIASEENFTLVCEMPYLYHNSIEDTSLTGFDRRYLRLQSLEYTKNISMRSKKIFRHIKKFCDKSTRMYTAVEDYIRVSRPMLEFEINVTKTSPMYHGKATVSQAFDLNVASRYYSLLTISMIVRLCEEVISIHPDKEVEIKKIKSDLEEWIEQKIKELLSGIKFEVIPIQKLVRVQIGSAFITLENLLKK